jgi:hypothetical protein
MESHDSVFSENALVRRIARIENATDGIDQNLA